MGGPKGSQILCGTRPLSRPPLQYAQCIVYPARRGRPSKMCCHGWGDDELVDHVAKHQWYNHNPDRMRCNIISQEKQTLILFLLRCGSGFGSY
jgi:hypothetical protein